MSDPTLVKSDDPTLALIPPRRGVNTRTMSTLAMLTGLAFVVMLLSKVIPSVNGFLDFDFKDVVICIGGFTFGPAAAAMVAIVVAFIELITISGTGPIGFLMNVLATCGFCCTASFVYKRRHTMLGAVVGLGLGVVVLTTVMLLWNYLITPLYLEMSREAITAMLVPVFLPFNLVKGGMNMAATLLLYKPVVTALRKANLLPASISQEQPVRRVGLGFTLFSVALLATFVAFALVLMGVI